MNAQEAASKNCQLLHDQLMEVHGDPALCIAISADGQRPILWTMLRSREELLEVLVAAANMVANGQVEIQFKPLEK
jgi:hypothetical protein